ncbi:MAG: VWA domain-containing protein [Myxococcales bacterium]|nr:VWA domain-containing protein [Myxococcales bacterium]
MLLFAGAAPVVDRGEGPAGVGVRFGFLPEDTDLPDTAGWPVLFVDLLERDRSGPCRVHAAGRPLLLQAEADVTVTGPAGESRTLPARGGRVVVDALDQQGLYTLASAGREAWVAVVPPLVTTPPAAAALSAPTSPPAPRRQPWVLASLALLALVLVLSRRWATPLAWPALVLAGIALADPRPGGEPGQVVLAVDTSDSMPRDETPAAVDALRRRLPAATTQIEGAGEVGRAHAGGPPTLGGRRTRHGPLIAAAARLAGPGGVIVLLTDGRAEDGPVASPLPVVVVPARAAAPDARVLGARALRLGPQVFVHATLAADREVAATVTVGEVSLPVALGPDARAVQAVVPAGAQVIEVRVAAAGDPVAANDALPVAVEGGRPPAAVVVGGGAVGWAESAGLGAREVPGAGLVEAGAGLGLVRAMFIHDQPAATFPPAVTAGLARWVAAGGVLVLAGRADAFGPGGWAGTPLDDLSPLRADPREPAASRVRVALALDRSGSMAREAGGIGPEAVGTLAASLAGSLRPRDEVGVLAFGLDAEALLAPTPVEKLTADGLQVPALVRGGTRLGPALALARRQLAGAQERVLVVLSDGRFSDAEAPALEAEAAALEGAGVRVVAVLTGEDPSREPLASLARRTGGTVVQAAGGQVERYATAGVLGAVSDGFFAPGGPVVAGSGWAARVGGAPPAVDRRVRVAARPEARVLAEAGGDPLLAEWAIGQGRVIALATDRWDLGADQWAALLAPAVAPRPADAALELEDGLLVFQGLAEDPPPHGLVVVEGQGGSVAVPWHPVGPGRAVAALPPGDTEVLTISSPSPRGAVQARVTRPPPAELRATGADAGAVALQARLSGGRVAEVGDAAAAVAALRGRQPGTPLAPWLLLLAVLALALDAARWAGLGRPLAVSTGRRRPFGRT